MRHVFATMGTVASITLPGNTSSDLCRDVEREFALADARFSLHRSDSELSRINRGELSLVESSEQVRAAYGYALEWGHRTGGVFTPNRPDGAIDLNGVVKARAIASAGQLLDRAHVDDWAVNVGGDVLFRGNAALGAPWSTGVVDPLDRGKLLCAVDLSQPRRAIATSGSAERGDHIWRGGCSSSPVFRQVTVVADDIVMADVFATSIVAGGERTLNDVTDRWDIDVLAVEFSGRLLATPGIRSNLSEAGR